MYFVLNILAKGYDVINQLINNVPAKEIMHNTLFYGKDSNLLIYLGLVLIFKVFATTATNGGGGCGGVFAPSLFLGCIAGFLFAHLWDWGFRLDVGSTCYVSPKNCGLYGMAGLMSGVMHAPLTGIFLIAELTGGYALFMPLMIVATGSYLTIKYFEPHSIYAMRLAQRGELLTHHTDKSILTLMSMDSVIQHYDHVLYPDMNLGDVATQVSNSKNHVFPVVNKQMQFVGAVYLDDIRHLVFRTELYRDFAVSQLMTQPEALLSVNDPMEVVVSVFDKTGAWTLPVVDEEGIFVGFIRKSTVLTVYRQMLADLSND